MTLRLFLKISFWLNIRYGLFFYKNYASYSTAVGFIISDLYLNVVFLPLSDCMLADIVPSMQGLVRVTVAVPNIDEGNLKGQVLEITMQSLSETVGSLKEKIAGEIQLPANKQKLSGKAGFLKDNMSLAYYNVGPGELLALSLRERGGRKR
jgi:hypothetical protein